MDFFAFPFIRIFPLVFTSHYFHYTLEQNFHLCLPSTEYIASPEKQKKKGNANEKGMQINCYTGLLLVAHVLGRSD